METETISGYPQGFKPEQPCIFRVKGNKHQLVVSEPVNDVAIAMSLGKFVNETYFDERHKVQVAVAQFPTIRELENNVHRMTTRHHNPAIECKPLQLRR